MFLCLPPDRLDAYSRWLRLLVAQALTDMARSPVKPARPVLFLLDEFAALGRLEPVERAMGLMAGYGLQLWPILQDMHQLRALYGERAGTFLSNAGVLQAFGVNDHATAELLSKSMGQETLEFRTAGYSETHGSIFERSKHTRSTSTQVSARNLMNPDEIMRMGPDEQLLMIQGKDPSGSRKSDITISASSRGWLILPETALGDAIRTIAPAAHTLRRFLLTVSVPSTGTNRAIAHLTSPCFSPGKPTGRPPCDGEAVAHQRRIGRKANSIFLVL
ncbi:type IV secretory system conjugative DNA transfer family protein [Sphingobium scionense]